MVKACACVTDPADKRGRAGRRRRGPRRTSAPWAAPDVGAVGREEAPWAAPDVGAVGREEAPPHQEGASCSQRHPKRNARHVRPQASQDPQEKIEDHGEPPSFMVDASSSGSALA
jgi:hypothetical protein